jgi:hypothetical protein
VGVGRDVADEAAARSGFGGEGELGFDFGVFREAFGVVERDGGASGVYFIAALVEGGEGFGDAVDVVEEVVGRINQDSRAVGAFGLDLEAPEDGGGEGLRDRELLGGVSGAAAEGLVGLDEEHFGTNALEVQDDAFGDLAAVEPEIVGARAVRQGVGVDEVRAVAGGVEVRDFEVELAGACVPVEREVAVDVLHTRYFGLEGDRSGRRRCGGRLGLGQCGDQKQG